MTTPTLKELMTPGPGWCTPHDSLDAAARLMAEHDCGAIPVVDDPMNRRPAGMITDRDIVLRAVARGVNTLDCRVQDVMSPRPISLHVDAPFADCARAMCRHHVRRVMVVDDRGRLIGIVTDGDLARSCRTHPELEHDLRRMLEAVSDPSHPCDEDEAPADMALTGHADFLSRPNCDG